MASNPEAFITLLCDRRIRQILPTVHHITIHATEPSVGGGASPLNTRSWAALAFEGRLGAKKPTL